MVKRQNDARVVEFIGTYGPKVMPLPPLLAECVVTTKDLVTRVGSTLSGSLLIISAQSRLVSGSSTTGLRLAREGASDFWRDSFIALIETAHQSTRRSASVLSAQRGGAAEDGCESTHERDSAL